MNKIEIHVDEFNIDERPSIDMIGEVGVVWCESTKRAREVALEFYKLYDNAVLQVEFNKFTVTW